MRLKLISVCLASLVMLAPGYANIVKNPNDLKWRPFPHDAKLEYSILSGNPLKKGLFTVRLKLPKNYSDVVHEHSKDRLDTIISGTYYIGFGSTINKTTATKMIPGSFMSFPAHVKHYGFTQEGAIIQITGKGPWEVLKTKGVTR